MYYILNATFNLRQFILYHFPNIVGNILLCKAIIKKYCSQCGKQTN